MISGPSEVARPGDITIIIGGRRGVVSPTNLYVCLIGHTLHLKIYYWLCVTTGVIVVGVREIVLRFLFYMECGSMLKSDVDQLIRTNKHRSCTRTNM